MKHLVAVVCGLGVGVALGADTPVIKGQLSFDSGGSALVAECGTSRVITLGVMASNPYFGLTQQYKEASDSGTLAVLVEVKGSLAKASSSDHKLVLNSPEVVSLVRGTCADATPNTSLERTREG